jgi:hypothetical protein
MSGAPFKALQKGAELVGKTIFEEKNFAHFITLFYDSGLTVVEESNFLQY